MAGSKQALDGLHKALVGYMIARMNTAYDASGNKITEALPAAELAVFTRFLKDNGIVVDKDHADDLLKLQAQLDSEKTEAGRNEILNSAMQSLMEDDDGVMH